MLNNIEIKESIAWHVEKCTMLAIIALRNGLPDMAEWFFKQRENLKKEYQSL